MSSESLLDKVIKHSDLMVETVKELEILRARVEKLEAAALAGAEQGAPVVERALAETAATVVADVKQAATT